MYFKLNKSYTDQRPTVTLILHEYFGAKNIVYSENQLKPQEKDVQNLKIIIYLFCIVTTGFQKFVTCVK